MGRRVCFNANDANPVGGQSSIDFGQGSIVHASLAGSVRVNVDGKGVQTPMGVA
jgi:hypothetical protein